MKMSLECTCSNLFESDITLQTSLTVRVVKINETYNVPQMCMFYHKWRLGYSWEILRNLGRQQYIKSMRIANPIEFAYNQGWKNSSSSIKVIQQAEENVYLCLCFYMVGTSQHCTRSWVYGQNCILCFIPPDAASPISNHTD